MISLASLKYHVTVSEVDSIKWREVMSNLVVWWGWFRLLYLPWILDTVWFTLTGR